MKKLFKRIFAGSLLALVVTISGIGTIIFFPEPLFAKELHHKQFNVYSNNVIDESMTLVLDNALDLVRTSELYDPEYTFDIFLSHKSFFNTIDDAVLGHGPAARATDNNVVVKVYVTTQQNLAFPTYYEQCQVDLTYLIAHEMIHCLQENKYGKWKFNPFNHPPYWKLEGYPEYVARQGKRLGSNYSLVAELDRYVELEKQSDNFWMQVEEGGCKAPKYYYKSRLMTEYLMDIKHQTYDQILWSNVSEEEIFAEMIVWKDNY